MSASETSSETGELRGDLLLFALLVVSLILNVWVLVTLTRVATRAETKHELQDMQHERLWDELGKKATAQEYRKLERELRVIQQTYWEDPKAKEEP